MAQPDWVGGLQAWGGVSLSALYYSSYTSQSKKCHDDEAERPDTLAIGMRVIEKDHQEDAEGRFHHGLAGEEEAQVLEHAKDHLDQEAGGVKDLERRVDLHHGQRDHHDVP